MYFEINYNEILLLNFIKIKFVRRCEIYSYKNLGYIEKIENGFGFFLWRIYIKCNVYGCKFSL